MADKTGIQWADASWNPIRGCSRVSTGCENCYAERQAHRMNHPGGAYQGLTTMGKHGPRWTGAVRLVPELLDQPLRWKKPRLIFVNSMSDLFHPDVPPEFIGAVFGVMAACPQHTFQILTKRPSTAALWFRRIEGMVEETSLLDYGHYVACSAHSAGVRSNRVERLVADHLARVRVPWPLPNVWMGTSAEDQKTADERLPSLMQVPAAVRWVSAEPLLGPIDLRLGMTPLDWVVVGGESGPRARPCEPQWIREIVQQCQRARVPVFVKQLGGCIAVGASAEDEADGRAMMTMQHRKGGDPSEWPEDLRVRQWPEASGREPDLCASV